MISYFPGTCLASELRGVGAVLAAPQLCWSEPEILLRAEGIGCHMFPLPESKSLGLIRDLTLLDPRMGTRLELNSRKV